MPDELTDAQAGELRADLLRLRAELQASLDANADSEDAVNLDQPIGRVSRIDAIQQQQMAIANRERRRQRLRAVEVALSWLSEGTYGLCRACDEDIGYPRLRARPESALCLACQSASER